MKRRSGRICVGIICLVAILTIPLVATASYSILYFNDQENELGTDRMAQALAAVSGTYSVTTVTTSADFATQIATGNYALGVFMVQYYASSSCSDGITALGTFVAAGGGRSIYTDWSQNNTYAALFGTQWAPSGGSPTPYGHNEYSITITDPTLATGIANPISLYNPQHGVFSMDLSGGTIAATFEDGNGAIAIGMSGRSITNGFLADTFSDGAQGVQLYDNEINFLLPSTPVPEPATMLLLGFGLIGLAGVRRKFKKYRNT